MTAQKSIFLILVLLLVSVSVANAEDKKYQQDFGQYIVHYNALPTDFLSPAAAKQAKVTRSRNRIMLNIAVKQKAANNTTEPVAADIKVIATNLTGQVKQPTLRPIKDGKSIYYIGELSVAHQERLRFTVEVKPKLAKKTYTVKFDKTFTTH